MGAITEPTSAEESSTGEEGTLSDVDSEEAAATSDSDLDPATKVQLLLSVPGKDEFCLCRRERRSE